MESKQLSAVENAREIFAEASTHFTNASANYADAVTIAYDDRVEKEKAARALVEYEAVEVNNGRAGVGGNADERKRQLLEWRSEDLEYGRLESVCEDADRAAAQSELTVEIARFDISLAKRRMEFAIALLRNGAEERI